MEAVCSIVNSPLLFFCTFESGCCQVFLSVNCLLDLQSGSGPLHASACTGSFVVQAGRVSLVQRP